MQSLRRWNMPGVWVSGVVRRLGMLEQSNEVRGNEGPGHLRKECELELGHLVTGLLVS